MEYVNVLSYLSEQKKTNNKELAAEWTEIELLFSDRQWNKLTKKMISFINHPELQNEDNLLQLYHNFISSFTTKINPYELVEIASIITSFMSDKKEAVKFLEKIEEKVKIWNEAVWLCWVLKGQIHLIYFQDLVATKKIIDELNLVLDELGCVSVHPKILSFTSNYYRRVGGQHSDDYHQLEAMFNKEIIRLNNEIIRQQKEFDEKNSKLKIEMEKEFDEKICKFKIEMESKFTTEAVRNFEEVIKSQIENDRLRNLNNKIIVECSQLRIEKNGLKDVNTKLEKDLLEIKSEQEQQKQVLLLLADRMENMRVKSDHDGADPKHSS